MTPFVQQMLGRRKELDENISIIQQKLLNYPDGKLSVPKTANTSNGITVMVIFRPTFPRRKENTQNNSQRRNIGHFVWKNLSVNNEQQKHICDVIAT